MVEQNRCIAAAGRQHGATGISSARSVKYIHRKARQSMVAKRGREHLSRREHERMSFLLAWRIVTVRAPSLRQGGGTLSSCQHSRREMKTRPRRNISASQSSVASAQPEIMRMRNNEGTSQETWRARMSTRFRVALFRAAGIAWSIKGDKSAAMAKAHRRAKYHRTKEKRRQCLR